MLNYRRWQNINPSFLLFLTDSEYQQRKREIRWRKQKRRRLTNSNVFSLSQRFRHRVLQSAFRGEKPATPRWDILPWVRAASFTTTSHESLTPSRTVHFSKTRRFWVLWRMYATTIPVSTLRSE